MKKITLVLVSFSFNFILNAQNVIDDFWNYNKETEIQISGKRQIIPKKYITFQLKTNELKLKLIQSPNEKNTPINLSNCIISLPLPNGTIQKFKVVESPIMMPELSEAFPNIKTYSIKGIDDPYANGKLDLTEFGFHGMVLSINGDFFIDPYCLGNTEDYIVYYTTDFTKDPSQILPEAELVLEGNYQKKAPKPEPTKTSSKSNVVTPAICVGEELRSYRLAIACTKQYANAATGLAAPTIAQTLSKIVTSVNRLDGVYEKEISVRLILVPTTTLVIYPSAASNSFTTNDNNNPNSLLNKSQLVINANIGAANYDIGHTFSTGGGGLAVFGVCNNNYKAMGITGSPSPVGDPYDIDYVAHEIGHQFGGNHTFNAGTGSCSGNRNASTSVEPGSGITIMAYAGICGGSDNLGNNSIPYFHAISFDEIVNFTHGSGNSCAITSTTGNNPPLVSGTGDYTIPISTPFVLTGSAIDPDIDPLTYSWEETDPGLTTSSWNSGTRPYFRSYAPIASPIRYFPKVSVVALGNYTSTQGEYLPTTPQTLQFRLTARDNKMGGGGVCYGISNITIDNLGPFLVTYPDISNIVWNVNTLQTITWDLGGTDQSPIACDSVRILISYNSGNTYSVLVNSTPNDGAELILVPTLAATNNTCRIKIESIGNVFYDIGNNNFTISTSNPGNGDVGVYNLSRNNPIGLSVWPNPFKNDFNFAVGNLNADRITNLKLSNLLGEIIFQTNYFNKTEIKDHLNLASLNKGVYFLNISNDNKQGVYRIIKD